PIPVSRLYPLICIGYFGNNVYPFRAGELIRSYVLKRNQQISITSSLATVIIERVFDGLVMLLFVFLALPFAPMPAQYRNLVVILTALMVAAAALFIWMAVRPQRMAAAYGWVAERFLPRRIRPRVGDLYARLMEALASPGPGEAVPMIFRSEAR